MALTSLRLFAVDVLPRALQQRAADDDDFFYDVGGRWRDLPRLAVSVSNRELFEWKTEDAWNGAERE